jgi:hypothetical protein
MKYTSCFTLLFALTLSMSAVADDAQTNPIAKKVKAKILKALKNEEHRGFCTVFIEMTHSGSTAIVKRVKTSGDYDLCKLSRSKIKKGQRFKYRTPEKYLRLHIEK